MTGSSVTHIYSSPPSVCKSTSATSQFPSDYLHLLLLWHSVHLLLHQLSFPVFSFCVMHVATHCYTALVSLPYNLNRIFLPSAFLGHQLPFLRKLKLSGVFRLWNLTDFYRLHTIWVFKEHNMGSYFTQGCHKHLPEIKGSPKNTSPVPWSMETLVILSFQKHFRHY